MYSVLSVYRDHDHDETYFYGVYKTFDQARQVVDDAAQETVSNGDDLLFEWEGETVCDISPRGVAYIGRVVQLGEGMLELYAIIECEVQ